MASGLVDVLSFPRAAFLPILPVDNNFQPVLPLRIRLTWAPSFAASATHCSALRLRNTVYSGALDPHLLPRLSRDLSNQPSWLRLAGLCVCWTVHSDGRSSVLSRMT